MRRAGPQSVVTGLDDGTATGLLLAVGGLVGLVLVVMSRRQPFPEPSRRYGLLVLSITLLLLLGTAAPRPPGVDGLLWAMSVGGAFGVLVGLTHMVRTRRDVVVAPLAGVMLCVGIGGLMSRSWSTLSPVEQWIDFLALVLLGMGQVYLVFRGLLIGKLPLAWSQAGLVALQRGQLEGAHGAIACFERGWAVDEPHLNPMAYLALAKIEAALGRPEKAASWKEALEAAGGVEAVAPEWIAAIEGPLLTLVPDAATRWENAVLP